MSTSMNENLIVRNQIEITQVDSPHKFWYKRCNDQTQDHLLSQLEESLTKYVSDLCEWEEQMSIIRRGDVIAAFDPEKQRWIRAKAGKIKQSDKNAIEIWAIDYGQLLTVELENAVSLRDQTLASRRPINVHIGGLAGISPAKHEFNVETFQTEVVKIDKWLKGSTEKFTEWIYDRKIITYVEIVVQGGRNFGQLLLHSDENNSTFCVASGLCDIEHLAIRDKKYINGVDVLNREDFMRLNHELCFWPPDEVDFDENAAERIWANDDPMPSIDLESESSFQQDISQQNGQSGQHGAQGYSDQHENVSQHSQHHPSTRSDILGYISIAESSMSTDSMTLSVKTLNKLNLLVITEDDVVPTQQWSDTFYFTKQMKSCLQQLYPRGIEPQCSYGWPHIMRTNSLLLIGETSRNMLLCLPTICSTVYRAVSDWTTSVRIEPIAIICVPTSGDVERVAQLCRSLLKKSKMDDVNVFCLNSSFEIETLVGADNIDILVTSVFCSQAFTQHMPMLFRSKRFKYIWFHQIDEMCKINESKTFEAVNSFLVSGGMDIQVVATAKNYCSILHELFHMAKLPMLSIGNRSPFEAALFAKCHFKADIVSRETKVNCLIDTLRDVDSKMTGSIVIMCANKMDVKCVTGSLTQANIKCVEFDDQYSGNQMKLVNWTKRCLSSQYSFAVRNILVCDDEHLRMFPIRTAAHVVHYSLPNKLETFMQRFITCYGFYEDTLRRELLHNEDEINLSRPFSLVYFDDNHTDEYIETYELLLNRTQCEMPPDLTEIVQEMRFDYELRKMKPLCSKLITKAKDCDMSCPYRHVLTDCEEPDLPEFGFVNMDLLDVISPSHFAVRVVSYKRCLDHKSRPVENHDAKWMRFNEKLCDFYSDGRRERHLPVEVGDICVIFHQSQPKRCRVMSKSKKNVCVYLIDIGRVRNYHEDNLYRLDAEFHDFPSQAVEIFVLGYGPSDSNPEWLPEAKQWVVHMMESIKEQRKSENYLQAEVLKTFERTLLVKDMKMMFRRKNGLKYKAIGQTLIKNRIADIAPIKLHDIFVVSESGASGQWAVNSEIQDATVVNRTATIKLRVAVDLCPSSNASIHTGAFSYDAFKEPMAPPNSVIILGGDVAEFLGNDEFDAAVGLKHSSEMEWGELIAHDCPTPVSAGPSLDEIFGSLSEDVQATDVLLPFIKPIAHDFPAPVSAGPSLDEIFGSLPENVQATDVLLPFVCGNNSVDADVKPAVDGCDWLIDFSDNDNNDANYITSSPLTNVRVINPIDDFFLSKESTFA